MSDPETQHKAPAGLGLIGWLANKHETAQE